MNKKEWLDFLYYDIGKQQYDFMLCGLRKVGDIVKATKWKKYSEVCFPLEPWEYKKIEWINQRQILPNEVVLDLENKENIDSILRELKSLEVEVYVYDTGSRGYHIDLFFDREMTEQEKGKIISHFGADTQKASPKTMIALEFIPHWKSGKIKRLVKDAS